MTSCFGVCAPLIDGRDCIWMEMPQLVCAWVASPSQFRPFGVAYASGPVYVVLVVVDRADSSTPTAPDDTRSINWTRSTCRAAEPVSRALRTRRFTDRTRCPAASEIAGVLNRIQL